MYTAKITSIEKVRHQATGTDFLDVSVHIIDAEGVVVSEQKHGFAPTISKDELLAEVEKIRAGYVRDEEAKAANAENDAINENVYELQKELVGSEITNNDEK